MSEQQVLPAQVPFNCRGCGLHIVETGTACPRCGYPMDPAEEFRLLKTVAADLKKCASAGGATIEISTLTQFSALSIRALHRVSTYGGPAKTVGWLIWHYNTRLAELHRMGVASAALPADTSQQASSSSAIHAGTSSSPAQPSVPHSAALPANSAPASAASAKSLQTLPVPRRPRSNHVATLRPLVDSPVGLMVALGTFLILIAILALPFLPQYSSYAIGVTFIAQIFFGAIAVATRRDVRFREFSRLYGAFFFITIPLLVIDIILSSGLTNIPVVVSVAALYAAVTCGAFAIYERFSPFGYLSSISLVACVVAFTLAFQDGYQWVSCTSLLLALLALSSLRWADGRPPSPLARLFDTTWAVLRNPTRFTMLAIVFLSAFVYVTTVTIFLFTGYSEVALSFVFSGDVTLLLLLVWLCLYIQRMQWNAGHYLVTLLSLLCVLVGINNLQLPPPFTEIGYALALIGVASVYDFIGRTRPQSMRMYIQPGLFLDVLALILIALAPLLVAPLVPVLDFTSNRMTFTPATPTFPLEDMASSMLVLLILVLSCLLSVSIIVRCARTPLASSSVAAPVNRWPWVLLLSGMLLDWMCGAIVLWVGINTFWGFFALTLFLLVISMFVRQKLGKRWSYPTDAVALGTAIVALLAALQGGYEEFALYALAIIFYVVLLGQRRSAWMFIPFIFALLALPYLFQSNATVILGTGVLLSLFAAVFYRFSGNRSRISFPLKITNEQFRVAWEWEWPLTVYALICSVFTFFYVLPLRALSLFPWIPLQLSPVIVVSVIALSWYVASALSRYTGGLWLAGAFGIAATFFIDRQLWMLGDLTLITTLVGLLISQLAWRVWALPFYSVALSGGVLLGITGTLSTPVWMLTLTIWLLLGVMALIYLVAFLEKSPWGNWLATVFAVWAFGIGAAQHNFLFLFAATLCCASVAMFRSFISKEKRGNVRLHSTTFLMHTLPIYTMAFAAALLMYGEEMFASPVSLPILLALLVDAAIAFIIARLESLPEMVVLSSALAVWAIALSRWNAWQLTLAYSVLCVCIFWMQYSWETQQPEVLRRRAIFLLRVLSTGGQSLVVFFAVVMGVLPSQKMTAQAGVFALLVLAGLLAWLGNTKQAPGFRFWCNYTAGLLLTLAVTDELNIISNSSLPFDLLAIAPASYLAVTSPFLLRQKTGSGMQQSGYVLAIIGTMALLVPSFSLSFYDQNLVGGIPGNLLAVFLLLGETFALLLLGLAVRKRFFVLGGCMLVIVGALRVFFFAIFNTSPLAILGVVIAGLAILGTAVYLVIHQRSVSGGVRHTP